MKEHLSVATIIVSCFFLVLVIAIMAAGRQSRQRHECESRGGVLVEGLGRLVCMSGEIR